MNQAALVLLIHDNLASGSSIRQALEQEGSRLKVQCMQKVSTALARIAGGGVDLVVLDLSSPETPAPERVNSLLKFRAGAVHIPLIVVSASQEDSQVLEAVRSGAFEHVPQDRCSADLGRSVRAAIERSRSQVDAHLIRSPSIPRHGIVIAVVGAKGGVGTTTVALNMAAAFADRHKVVLAELQPGFGILWQYLHPQPGARNLWHLLQQGSSEVSGTKAEKYLWPSRIVPGLHVLFGPRTAEQCLNFDADCIKALTAALATLADYVVLDLPATVSTANRAAIETSDCMVLVSERDPFALACGRQIVETVQSWNVAPLLGAVIVNRVSLATPMGINEMETKLGIPILGLVPPAADLCLAAQRSGSPLIIHDPESLAALALTELKERLKAGPESYLSSKDE